MDLSTTTSPVYRKYIEMAEELTSKLLIGRRFTRIALITFSSVGKSRVQFNLDRLKFFFLITEFQIPEKLLKLNPIFIAS